MLRALTIIAVVVGLVLVAWSVLVMTGARDWLVATMATEEKAAEATSAKTEPAPSKDAKQSDAKPQAEAKPAGAESAAKAKPAGQGAPAKDAESTDEAKPADTGAPGAAPREAAAEAKPASESGAAPDPGGNPMETAKNAEKGTLKSPYRDNYESVADEGHKKFMAAGCNGCHGGTGGGGMGPPLSNPVWIYGNDGDTLFRLIALGSDGLQAQGYTRKGSENVVGPMPPHGKIVKSNDDLWKIIAWIWSINPPDKSAAAQKGPRASAS
jgi:hypothetical protein